MTFKGHKIHMQLNKFNVFQQYNSNNIISRCCFIFHFTVCIFYMIKYGIQKLETLTLRSAAFLLLDKDVELMPEFYTKSYEYEIQPTRSLLINIFPC